MCGIGGWLTLTGDPPGPDVLNAMLDEIRHRGPDEQGRLDQKTVSLGMTRLSINDLDGGSQPYYNEDRTVAAVFNGEIYNFRQLREDLERRGHSFRSQTDGEVIVHLYEEFGETFVERLNGMFAIALWDGQDLHLYRDRFGIKPLYYGVYDGVFYFASEVKCLRKAGGFTNRLNHQALRSYLTMEYVPSPDSIYADTFKLAPAHRLKITSGELKEPVRYWQFPALTADSQESLEVWAHRLREELKASVKRRLLADVPLGVFLSGGLDSSSITALMTEICPGQVKSFSVGFSEKTFDESSYSRAVAKHLGTEHYEQVLHPQMALEIIEPLYDSLDEPMADAAIIPTYLLSKFARRHVTVALAGEGADELLGGYPTYFAHQMAHLVNWMPAPVFDLLRGLVNRLPTSRKYLSFDFKLKRFCSGLGLPDKERHLTWMGSLPWSSSERFLLHPAPQAYRLTEASNLGLVEKIQTLDFHTYLSEGLLVKLDRATMLTSLEGRVPFLDHTLVESMASLPTAFKLQGMDAKRVLKTALGLALPKEVVQRKKKGFGIPLADWLRGPLRFLLDEYLSESYLQGQGLFHPRPVRRLVEEHLSGAADRRKSLWTLLVFQRWWDKNRPV